MFAMIACLVVAVPLVAALIIYQPSTPHLVTVHPSATPTATPTQGTITVTGLNEIDHGETLTLTASLNPLPTSAIVLDLYQNDTVIAGNIPVTDGIATYTLIGLSPGSYSFVFKVHT